MTLYNDYNSYLRNRYGCKIYRIGLDAGFSCPNRDGTKGSVGCVYCNEDGSRSAYTDPGLPVEAQLASGIEHLKKTKGAEKFIAYFQAFTNTYAGVDKLKSIYDAATAFSEVVGMTIGTRPDAIDRKKLALIASYRKRCDVWIEYGLQSIHDRTLAAMGRGHTFADFLDAFSATRESGIKVCVHVILGFPGETREDMLETAQMLTELKIDAVKIHLLHILKGSALEQPYREGRVQLLEQDDYVRLACDFLENLAPDIIIQRLTGEGRGEAHIAPAWALDKTGTIGRIRKELQRRGTRQGLALNH